MQSISENDLECFASTGVNAPVTMFPDSGSRDLLDFPEANFCVARYPTSACHVSGPGSAFTTLWPARLPSRSVTLTPKAPTASLPPPPFRLLLGGTNQFPSGNCTRRSPAPFHVALSGQLRSEQERVPRNVFVMEAHTRVAA